VFLGKVTGNSVVTTRSTDDVVSPEKLSELSLFRQGMFRFRSRDNCSNQQSIDIYEWNLNRNRALTL